MDADKTSKAIVEASQHLTLARSMGANAQGSGWRGGYKSLWLTYYSWVLPAQKAIYFSVPKNACTSMKRLMLRIEGRMIPVNPGDVHKVGVGKSLAFHPPEIILGLLTSPDWFRFCVVRNPYDRLVSAYKSKLGMTKVYEDRFIPMRVEIGKHFRYPEDKGKPYWVLSFRDFIRWIAEDQDRWDDHWEMQVRTLRTDVVDYHFVMRFERLKEDLGRLFEKLKIKPIPMERLNNTMKTPLAWFYDRELADIVYNLYKPDFDRFGYNRDSWMFE